MLTNFCSDFCVCVAGDSTVFDDEKLDIFEFIGAFGGNELDLLPAAVFLLAEDPL